MYSTSKKIIKSNKKLKKKKHNKIVILARSKLNSIESNQISHEDFITIVNEEKNYREIKESIRIVKGQEDKKIDID